MSTSRSVGKHCNKMSFEFQPMLCILKRGNTVGERYGGMNKGGANTHCSHREAQSASASSNVFNKSSDVNGFCK